MIIAFCLGAIAGMLLTIGIGFGVTHVPIKRRAKEIDDTPKAASAAFGPYRTAGTVAPGEAAPAPKDFLSTLAKCGKDGVLVSEGKRMVKGYETVYEKITIDVEKGCAVIRAQDGHGLYSARIPVEVFLGNWKARVMVDA